MKAPTDKKIDPASRGHMLRSVLFNWTGHLVFIIAGFLIPRLVDRQLGPELLGVWDLGWSLVGYLDLMLLGLVSAVNRYVARYRETGDWDALNQTVSVALALTGATMLLAIGVVGAFVAVTPYLLGALPAASIRQAQWMVFVLGLSAAIQLPSGIFNGVVSGCARFGLKNGIRSGVHVLVIVAMVAALQLGHGIVALAAASFAGELLTAGLFAIASFRLCPTLRLSLAACRWNTARELIGFGSKGLAASVARSILYQTNAVLITLFLGPMALAVFVRQRALVTHVVRLATQFGNVFIPAGSTLQARGDQEKLNRLLSQSAKYAMCIALPPVILLVLLGNALVHLWMGSAYVSPAVLGILAIGHLASLSQRGTYAVLVGMNKHGPLAWAEVIAACTSVVLGVVFVGVLGWGLVGAALGVALPVTIGGGWFVLRAAAREIGVGWLQLLRKIAPTPLVACAPCLAVVLATTHLCQGAPLRTIAWGSLVGGLALGISYWALVLPASLRVRILSALRGYFGSPLRKRTGSEPRPANAGKE